MELLDRYLQAVSRQLPRGRQQDILAELRANLEAQLEDREAELGRSLTQGEAEDWLRELGSPMEVAARYRTQQSLIGPTLFPMYWFVLRMALLWALGIYALVSSLLIVLGQPGGDSIAGAIWRTPWVLFMVAVWVTLFFAAMEFFAAKFPAKSAELMKGVTEWSPASLPPVEKPHPGFAPKSYAHAVAEVVFGFLFMVWLALIPHYPFLLVGPGLEYLRHSPFALAPVVMVFYYWVLALNVLQVGWHGVDLICGAWQRPQPWQHLIFKAFAAIPIIVLLRAPGHALVLLKSPMRDAAHYGATVATLNGVVHKALLVVLVIVVAQFVWDLGRWVMNRRSDGAVAGGVRRAGVRRVPPMRPREPPPAANMIDAPICAVGPSRPMDANVSRIVKPLSRVRSVAPSGRVGTGTAIDTCPSVQRVVDDAQWPAPSYRAHGQPSIRTGHASSIAAPGMPGTAASPGSVAKPGTVARPGTEARVDRSAPRAAQPPGRSCPGAQARSWLQASSSTHAPMGMIRPLSSATEMKRSGATSPCSGWFQRMSASTPTATARATSITGW